MGVRELYDGTRKTGLTVEPDLFWPDMWRVHYPDGTISDMVNISRATDAARQWLVSNSSRGNSRGLTWKEAAVLGAPRPDSKKHSDPTSVRVSQN